MRFKLLIAAACLFYSWTLSGSSQPNIVLILSDDHSYPNLGCYGDTNAITPNFDQFAKEGMRFNRAYTQAPQCVPSRASILTGRSPIDVDMTRFSAPLDKQFVTFAELLREAGYYTGAVGRSFHLDGPGTPNDSTKEIFDRHDLQTGKLRFDFLQVNGPQPRPEIYETVGLFLEKPKDQPFFLWVNFHQPHRRWSRHNTDRFGPDYKGLKLPPDYPDLPSVRQDWVNFYGNLEGLDRRFGEVLQVLEKRGDPKNTVILFMGDNGGALLRGKGTLYDRGTHVPMLVRWPDVINSDSYTDQLISGNDVAATFLELAGLDIPEFMSGKSFAPLLVGNEKSYQPRDAVFAQRGNHAYGLPDSTINFDLIRSVTTKTHRLIYNVLWDRRYAPVDIEDYGAEFWYDMRRQNEMGRLDPQLSDMYFSTTRPIFELYDLESDPYEMNNLAGSVAVEDIETDLKNRLAEWMILQRDFVPLPTEK